MAEACPPPQTAARSWFAVRCKSQHESIVSGRLTTKGIETWNPTFTEQSQWTDRKKTLTKSFFPGYLFVRQSERAADIVHTPGVIQILPASLDPVEIPDAEIQALKQALASRLPSSLRAYVAGDRAVVGSGPLAGFEGIVLRTRGSSVLLNILEHAVSVHRSVLKKAA